MNVTEKMIAAGAGTMLDYQVGGMTISEAAREVFLAMMAASDDSSEKQEASVRLSPISVEGAKDYLRQHSEYRGEFNLAICAMDEMRIHGVIALVADGATFALGHISTDGSAHIGSLLYGGAWRVAKALGYETIRI